MYLKMSLIDTALSLSTHYLGGLVDAQLIVLGVSVRVRFVCLFTKT